MGKEIKCCNSTRALIMPIGKSSKKICQYIIQNLRLSIEIKEDINVSKGTNFDIIINILNDNEHKTLNAFYNTYKGIDIEGTGEDRKIKKFKIFIVLDLEQCSEVEKQEYLDKTIFKSHWAYEYIVPIFNDKNLEDALKECNVSYEKKEFKDKKMNYVKVFPIVNKFRQKKTERTEVEEFRNLIKDSKRTNLKKMLDYCTNNNVNI